MCKLFLLKKFSIKSTSKNYSSFFNFENFKNLDIISNLKNTRWGISSAGRALRWQRRGQRFDPAMLHHHTPILKMAIYNPML